MVHGDGNKKPAKWDGNGEPGLWDGILLWNYRCLGQGGNGEKNLPQGTSADF